MEQLQDIRIEEKIQSVLKGGDILLINPPFNCINYPAFGLHLLQSAAKASGYKSEILYLNVLLTSIIGLDVAQEITISSSFAIWKMLGERLFARSAYGLPPLGKLPELFVDEAMSVIGNKKGYVRTFYENEVFDLETLKKIEATCKSFIDMAIPVIASLRYKIIGCTVQLGQTNAGIAILNGIKQTRPDIIALLGGTNCEGAMAEGTASLSDSPDYIFSGESELTFNQFLEGFSKGQLPSQRIIRGEPLKDLDSLSLPDYDSFFNQLDAFLGSNSPKEIFIIYQTSRGCWWGQKQKCSFCGVTNEQFRQKTGPKVLEDLEILNKRYPNKIIFMADNIMPSAYFKEIIPELTKKKYSNMHYMLRTNLKLEELLNLKAANVDIVTPGIEALSTGLLKLANKGITARENISLLRNARSLGIYLNWYLLWGFPGDKAVDYEETLNLIPLIRHLQPFKELLHILFERFSPYLKNPSLYRIGDFRPLAVYNMIFPGCADIDRVAFYFAADYLCESHTHPELIQKIVKEWELWKKMWKKSVLIMVPSKDFYMIYDRRNIDGKDKKYMLDYKQASEVMTTCVYDESEMLKWALEEKLGVVVDSWYVPLITTSPESLLELEAKNE